MFACNFDDFHSTFDGDRFRRRVSQRRILIQNTHVVFHRRICQRGWINARFIRRQPMQLTPRIGSDTAKSGIGNRFAGDRAAVCKQRGEHGADCSVSTRGDVQ